MCKRTKFASLLVLVSIVANIGVVSMALQASNSESALGRVGSAAHEILFSSVAYAEPTPYVIPEGGLLTAQHIAVIAPYAAPLEKEETARRTHAVTLTAYSSSPDETDSTPFITASGTQVRDGVVAANFLPIGTKIRIPDLYGEKVFVVEDRMHSRYQDRVDIWMGTKWNAQVFGRKTATIEVL